MGRRMLKWKVEHTRESISRNPQVVCRGDSFTKRHQFQLNTWFVVDAQQYNKPNILSYASNLHRTGLPTRFQGLALRLNLWHMECSLTGSSMSCLIPLMASLVYQNHKPWISTVTKHNHSPLDDSRLCLSPAIWQLKYKVLVGLSPLCSFGTIRQVAVQKTSQNGFT